MHGLAVLEGSVSAAGRGGFGGCSAGQRGSGAAQGSLCSSTAWQDLLLGYCGASLFCSEHRLPGNQELLPSISDRLNVFSY